MAEKELRSNGTLLPYSTYDRLSEIDQARLSITSVLAEPRSLSTGRARDNTCFKPILLEMALPDDGQSRKGRNFLALTG